MKTTTPLSAIVFIFLSINCLANSSSIEHNLFEINEFDSVFVSIKDATIKNENGDNIIEFPVYIDSDDVVNSLDLSFGIDTNKLEFVNVVSFTNQMDFAAFVNQSVFRLTSNSFLSYNTNRATIMVIRFKLLEDDFDAGYVTDLNTFLNGDQSGSEFEGDSAMVSTYEQELLNESLKLFPNPINSDINMISEFDMNFDLFNSNGQKVISNSIRQNEVKSLNLTSLSDGTYIFFFYDDNNNPLGNKRIVKNQ